MDCKHSNTTTRIRPFQGPVSSTQNRAAHGNTCRVQRCSKCAAERRTNVNGRHREVGPWAREQ